MSPVDWSKTCIACQYCCTYVALEIDAPETDADFDYVRWYLAHKRINILRALRAARKAPGQKRIYTAGEKEYLTSCARRKKGVPLNRETQREMMAMRDELGLKKYRFPFERQRTSARR